MATRPTIMSLCAGYGGLDLAVGLVFPGATAVCYCEREGYAAATLVARMEGQNLVEAPIWDDLSTLDPRPWRGKVDCITAGYPCFITGSLVLTETGYVPIESVRVGDKVLTHTGRWKRVTLTGSTKRASVREIRAQGIPGIVCTDNHPFYTRKVRGVSFTPPQWVEAKGIERGDFLGQVLPTNRNRSCEHPWLTGRFLADGYTQFSPSQRGKGRVVFCIGKEKAAEFDSQTHDVRMYRSTERTAYKYHLTNTKYARWLRDNFGQGAAEKRIPGWVLELRKEDARDLLLGYLSGDGYRQHNGWRANTTSKPLALGLCLLAQKVFGVVASCRLQRTSSTCKIEGRMVNQRDYWVVDIPDRNRSGAISGRYGWKYTRSNQTIEGTHTVYNLAVEEDESYMCDGAIVHNCQPFSVAGRKHGADDPRHLWPHIERIISVVEPSWCFFENVPHHLNLGFNEVARSLQEMGYTVAATLVSAEEVGASHKRERLFILAYTQSGQERLIAKWRESYAAQCRNTEFGDLRQAMADSQCNGRRADESVEGPQGRAFDGRDCEAMANSKGDDRRRELEQEEPEQDRWIGHPRGGQAVANSNDDRREVLREQGEVQRQDTPWDDAHGCSCATGWFPPGRDPGDPRWEHWPWPAYQPGFRRGSYGLAKWMDRLRLAGNGVVPLQGAYALCLMLADLEGER